MCLCVVVVRAPVCRQSSCRRFVVTVALGLVCSELVWACRRGGLDWSGWMEEGVGILHAVFICDDVAC